MTFLDVRENIESCGYLFSWVDYTASVFLFDQSAGAIDYTDSFTTEW